MLYGYNKKVRLTKNEEYKSVLSTKIFARSKFVFVYAKKNGLSFSRFGATVGKKSGNAVVRNRLKRLARESFRLSQHKIPAGYDFVLIYSTELTKNNNMTNINMEMVCQEFFRLARSAVKKIEN